MNHSIRWILPTTLAFLQLLTGYSSASLQQDSSVTAPAANRSITLPERLPSPAQILDIETLLLIQSDEVGDLYRQLQENHLRPQLAWPVEKELFKPWQLPLERSIANQKTPGAVNWLADMQSRLFGPPGTREELSPVSESDDDPAIAASHQQLCQRLPRLFPGSGFLAIEKEEEQIVLIAGLEISETDFDWRQQLESWEASQNRPASGTQENTTSTSASSAAKDQQDSPQSIRWFQFPEDNLSVLATPNYLILLGGPGRQRYQHLMLQRLQKPDANRCLAASHNYRRIANRLRTLPDNELNPSLWFYADFEKLLDAPPNSLYSRQYYQQLREKYLAAIAIKDSPVVVFSVDAASQFKRFGTVSGMGGQLDFHSPSFRYRWFYALRNPWKVHVERMDRALQNLDPRQTRNFPLDSMRSIYFEPSDHEWAPNARFLNLESYDSLEQWFDAYYDSTLTYGNSRTSKVIRELAMGLLITQFPGSQVGWHQLRIGLQGEAKNWREHHWPLPPHVAEVFTLIPASKTMSAAEAARKWNMMAGSSTVQDWKNEERRVGMDELWNATSDSATNPYFRSQITRNEKQVLITQLFELKGHDWLAEAEAILSQWDSLCEKFETGYDFQFARLWPTNNQTPGRLKWVSVKTTLLFQMSSQWSELLNTAAVRQWTDLQADKPINRSSTNGPSSNTSRTTFFTHWMRWVVASCMPPLEQEQNRLWEIELAPGHQSPVIIEGTFLNSRDNFVEYLGIQVVPQMMHPSRPNIRSR